MNASKAYELFVGQITVKEFVAPFDGDINKAVAQLMEENWWDSNSEIPAPDNLSELITAYCESDRDEK